jgi:hypothetical protein
MLTWAGGEFDPEALSPRCDLRRSTAAPAECVWSRSASRVRREASRPFEQSVNNSHPNTR